MPFPRKNLYYWTCSCWSPHCLRKQKNLEFVQTAQRNRRYLRVCFYIYRPFALKLSILFLHFKRNNKITFQLQVLQMIKGVHVGPLICISGDIQKSLIPAELYLEWSERQGFHHLGTLMTRIRSTTCLFICAHPPSTRLAVLFMQVTLRKQLKTANTSLLRSQNALTKAKTDLADLKVEVTTGKTLQKVYILPFCCSFAGLTPLFLFFITANQWPIQLCD